MYKPIALVSTALTALLLLSSIAGNIPVGAQSSATSVPTVAATSAITALNQTPAPVLGTIVAKLDCAALAKMDFSKIPDAATTISSAVLVPATATTEEGCKIDGTIAPQALFEIQLPTKTWNGDYVEGGCGGLCGSLNEPTDCTTAFGRGEVIGFSDLGHESGMNDNSWALTDVLRTDFAYHANHALALAAKTIVNAFYGQAPKYSYFIGCSDGGREALIEAQRYPTDFNGIVAGAPAAILSPLNYFKHAWDAQANTDAQGNTILTVAKLSVLYDAVMKACADLFGLISNPLNCHFDPATLKCPNNVDATNCLTQAQIDAANKIYSGPTDAQGNRYYPGGETFGSELGWVGWVVSPNGGPSMSAAITDAFVGYLAMPLAQQNTKTTYADVKFTPAAFDSIRAMAKVYDATNPDLTAFKANGGKLIVYHGWADPSIVPTGTLEYYSAVEKQMGGAAATQTFARLFMFPGVYHCGGGYGPSHYDLVTSITNWVEKGTAPDQIVATLYDTDLTQQGPGDMGGPDATAAATQPAGGPSGVLPTGGDPNASTGVAIRTLPAFPYPLVPKYTGTGNVNDAVNYVAAQPATLNNVDFKWLGSDLFSAP